MTDDGHLLRPPKIGRCPQACPPRAWRRCIGPSSRYVIRLTSPFRIATSDVPSQDPCHTSTKADGFLARCYAPAHRGNSTICPTLSDLADPVGACRSPRATSASGVVSEGVAASIPSTGTPGRERRAKRELSSTGVNRLR